MRPVERDDMSVAHQTERSDLRARGDVTRNELEQERALQARGEEIEQFGEQGVYERVEEEVDWW